MQVFWFVREIKADFAYQCCDKMLKVTAVTGRPFHVLSGYFSQSIRV